MEDLKKFTNIDPSTPRSQSLLGQDFINKSILILGRIPKVTIRPTNPYAQLLEVVFGVFNNQDQVEEEERTQHAEQSG